MQLPVTAGFLGAGKMTLLEHLRSNRRRAAVTVNDTSEVTVVDREFAGDPAAWRALPDPFPSRAPARSHQGHTSMRPRLSRIAALVAAATVLIPTAAHAQRVTLSTGHIDAVAPVFTDGSLSIKVKDDTGGSPVFRDPDDVLLHVKPEAHQTVPSGLPASYAFLGPAGSDVWLLPQVQDQDLLWPGWSSETIPSGVLKDDKLVWTLNSVEGPGSFQLYENGAFGTPRVLFDSADPGPDVETKPVGTHSHYTWVFHHQGMHTLHFSVEVELPSGTAQLYNATYRVFVGDLADLPPELVYFTGLESSYAVGSPVTLDAHQAPVSRFTDYRWLKRCPGQDQPEQVATGEHYSFSVAAGDDGCRISLSLRDDAGAELLSSSYDQAIYVDPGFYGPRRILSRGHTDVLNVSYTDGKLLADVKDDTEEPTVYRDPDKVLLHAKPTSATVIPEDLPEGYAFLGPAGATTWLLPEVQDPDLLWPGWETYGVPSGVMRDDQLRWRLLSVDGPGAMQLWLTGPTADPIVLFDSNKGLPATSTMGTSSHTHATWTFAKPGLYKLRFDLQGTLADGGQTVDSGPVEYWFYVGDLADLPPYGSSGGPTQPDPDPQPDPKPEPQGPTETTPQAPGGPAAPSKNTGGQSSTTPAAVVKAPRLTLGRPALRGRTLTLATTLGRTSRVQVTILRGTRKVTTARSRTLWAGRRTLRAVLGRTLPAGVYKVRIKATSKGRSVTRTRMLIVSAPTKRAVKGPGS